jgi:hypothetical protein
LGVSGEIPLDAALLDDRSLATVRRLQGEKLLQNSSDANSPSKPPTIRMIPSWCRSLRERRRLSSVTLARPGIRPRWQSSTSDLERNVAFVLSRT